MPNGLNLRLTDDPGIGLASPTPVSAPRATTSPEVEPTPVRGQAPAPEPAGEAGGFLRSLVEQRETGFGVEMNALEMAGAVMSNIAAGYEGRELPSDQLYARGRAARQEARQSLVNQLAFIKEGVAQLKGLSGEQRKVAAQRYASQLEPTFPGFTEMFAPFADLPDLDIENLQAIVGEDAGLLGTMFGPGEEKEAIAFHAKNKELFDRRRDRENMEVIDAKMGEWSSLYQHAMQDPEFARLAEQIPTDEGGRILFDSFGEFERINDIIGRNSPSVAFNESMMDTLRRNPQRAERWGISIPSPKLEEKLAEEARAPEELEFRTVGKDVVVLNERGEEVNRIRNESGADFNASEFKSMLTQRAAGGSAFDIPGVDPGLARQLDERFSPEEARRYLETGGSGTSLTVGPDGTIQLDMGPAAKVRAREQAKIDVQLAQPLDPSIRRMTGLPTMTNKEAGERGLTHEKSPSEIQKLQSQEASTLTTVDNVNDIINLVKDREDLTGAAASVARVFDNFRTHIVSFRKAFGGPTYRSEPESVQASTDVGAYQDVWEKLNIESGVLKSMYVSAAFALARAREGGRLTDQDIRYALENTLGGDARNPDRMVAVLSNFKRQLGNEWGNTVKANFGAEPPSILLSEQERDILSNPDEWDNLSVEELSSLSPEALDYLEKRGAKIERWRKR